MGELEGDAAALTLGCEEPLGDGEPDALGVALREGQEAVALCDGVALREGHEAVALLETLAAADADGEPEGDAELDGEPDAEARGEMLFDAADDAEPADDEDGLGLPLDDGELDGDTVPVPEADLDGEPDADFEGEAEELAECVTEADGDSE